MIEIRHISKKFRNRVAVDDVSLQMNTGIYGLVGPNGAGKTTLMRILATVLPMDQGEIQLGGKVVDQRTLRKYIGYLPQKFSFYKDLTLKEALVHVGFMKNMPKQNIDAEVQKVLQQVNLSERQNDRIGTLSGGMLRRLGIAQAILGDPEVLIVDEPTVGLDPEERKHFRRLLADIAENRIVLISTHIVEDIAEISTELIVMKNGKIIAEGTANEALAYL